MSTAVAPTPDLLRLPRPYCRLPDGRRGWFQRGANDCLKACVASVTGCDYTEAPSLGPWEEPEPGKAPELARWAEVFEWAADRGLRVRFHDERPDSPDWIAVDEPDEDGFRHTLAVMGNHVHDPASGFDLPTGVRAASFRRGAYAITFEPKENNR